jgi:eukaryotic-like serine/threonine-protein kinase
MRAIPKIDKSLDQTLGRYQLIALLGQGGMADVYLACTQGPGGFQKLLVVKLARFTGDPMLSRMFLDEARLAAQLSHPNVVQTFEVGEEGSRHFMVMEYLDGATLSRLRQRASGCGGVPLRVAVQILSQVLEGLEYAHQARGIDGTPLKVVHRDLTPSNIVITVQGVTKILDFGIAKAADSYSFTQAGRYSGKLTYMPPEQLRAERVDERADIFSVGVILAEAALGMRFWGNATEPMVASRLISGDLPSFEGVPELDPELRKICERALTPEREDRYPNATAFKEDLTRFLHKLGGPVPREELAEFVCSMIGEDRARLQAIVDSQLQQASRLPLGSEPALPELPRIEVTPPMRSALHTAPTIQHEPMMRSGSELGHDSVDVELIQEAPTEHSSSAPMPQLAPLPIPAGAPGPTVSVRTAGPARRTLLMAGIGGGVAVATVAAVLLLRSGPRDDRATGPAALATTAPAAPVAPPAPAAVRLEIVVSPPEAVVLLDGRSLGANPYVGVHPRDGQIHELTVTASGHQTLNQSFLLDRDMMLQLHLQEVREETVATAPASPSRPVPSRSGSSRAGSSRREPASREPTTVAAPAQPPTVAVEPAPALGERPASNRDGKRALDGDVFDRNSRPGKRALDADVFEAPTTKKPSIDRDTPWKK